MNEKSFNRAIFFSHNVRVFSVVSLSILIVQVLTLAGQTEGRDKVLLDWSFDSAFGQRLIGKADGVIALPIGLGGDALASETAGPSANEEAWQFHVIPDGESGGLETFLESGIESFSLGVVFKPKEASVPEHVQYLAGISDRAFLRITEANMLEAGLRGTDDVWVQVRFPLYKIRPLNQWIQVEVRYESQELSLIVNGQVEDSLTLKHYRIFSGARFVVATCPWDSSTGHFVGSIASLKLAMIDESSGSSR